jgi:hypothetical protein
VDPFYGFASSPVLAADVVIVANDQDPGGTSSLVGLDQKTGVVRWKIDRQSKKASEKYQLLARFNLGEASNSTPAVAGGRMYLRTLSQTMCLE